MKTVGISQCKNRDPWYREFEHQLFEEEVEDTDFVDVSPRIVEDTVEEFGLRRSGDVGNKSLHVD